MGLDVCFDSLNNRTIVRWSESTAGQGKIVGLVCNTSTGALTASGSVANTGGTYVDSAFHSDIIFNSVSGKGYNLVCFTNGNHYMVIYPITYNSSNGQYISDAGTANIVWATSEKRRYGNCWRICKRSIR